MKKVLTEEQKVINRLHSTVCDFIGEHCGFIKDRTILRFVSIILQDAKVDSQIIVKMLEDQEFGEHGKQEALAIKINEGW